MKKDMKKRLQILIGIFFIAGIFYFWITWIQDDKNHSECAKAKELVECNRFYADDTTNYLEGYNKMWQPNECRVKRFTSTYGDWLELRKSGIDYYYSCFTVKGKQNKEIFQKYFVEENKEKFKTMTKEEILKFTREAYKNK